MSKKSKTASDTKDIWFPAKKFGYGWGVPKTWQGWVALVGCLGIGSAPLLYLSFFYKGDAYCNNVIDQGIKVACDPKAEMGMYLLSAFFWLAAWVFLLIHICKLKGEPAKWRWSNKAKHAKKSKA